MPVEVRPVRPEEYEEAGRVTALAYREFVGGEERESYLSQLADVAGRVDRALVLAAVEDGRVLGTATLELWGRVTEETSGPLPEEEAHVRMLGVHPAARRRGIGRLLVQRCIAEAKRAGKKVLTLNTTHRMLPAQAMYEAMGFRRGPDRALPGAVALMSYSLPLEDSPKD